MILHALVVKGTTINRAEYLAVGYLAGAGVECLYARGTDGATKAFRHQTRVERSDAPLAVVIHASESHRWNEVYLTIACRDRDEAQVARALGEWFAEPDGALTFLNKAAKEVR